MTKFVRAIVLPVYLPSLVEPISADGPVKVTASLDFPYYTHMLRLGNEVSSSQPPNIGDSPLYFSTYPHLLLVEGSAVRTSYAGNSAKRHHLSQVGTPGTRRSLTATSSCEGARCTSASAMPVNAVHHVTGEIVYFPLPSAEPRALWYFPPPQLPDGISGEQLSLFLSKIRGVPLLLQNPFDLNATRTLASSFVTQAFPFWSASISSIGSIVTMVQNLWKQIVIVPFQILGPTPPLIAYNITRSLPSPSEGIPLNATIPAPPIPGIPLNATTPVPPIPGTPVNATTPEPTESVGPSPVRLGPAPG